MKSPTPQFAVFVIAATAAVVPARAQLPSLDVREWVGHFVALEFRDYHFALTSRAEGRIIPLRRNGKPISRSIHPTITFLIEETMPDGRSVGRKLRLESLESENEAVTALDSVTFRGETTGDARFEAYLEADRDVISIGGRVTDPGSLNPDGLRFTVRVVFPSSYRSYSKAEREERTFQRRVRGDHLALRRIDGSRVRLDTADAVDVAESELNGRGFAEARVSVDAYQDNRIDLLATEGSAMTLGNRSERPLHSGFWIQWQPDPEKDPDGESRLVFTVK